MQQIAARVRQALDRGWRGGQRPGRSLAA